MKDETSNSLPEKTVRRWEELIVEDITIDFGLDTSDIRKMLGDEFEEIDKERLREKCRRATAAGEVVHYRIGQDNTPCIQGGDSTVLARTGELYIADKDLVNCKQCLEWMYA